MKTIRKIAVIAVVLLCAAVFFGCGKETSNDPDVIKNDEQKVYEPYEFVGSPTDEYGNQGEMMNDGTDIDDELLYIEIDEEEMNQSDASEEEEVQSETEEDI